MQPVRGWTDEAWDGALRRLAARGWVGADGTLTSAGREAHAAVEDATDRAASRPWARLGPEATAEIAAALTPLARALGRIPLPQPDRRARAGRVRRGWPPSWPAGAPAASEGGAQATR